MSNKHKLKGTKIYIDNDMTLKERIIQAEIRKIAREEIGKGHKIKVGYRKITIEGEEHMWDEKKNGVRKRSKN